MDGDDAKDSKLTDSSSSNDIVREKLICILYQMETRGNNFRRKTSKNVTFYVILFRFFSSFADSLNIRNKSTLTLPLTMVKNFTIKKPSNSKNYSLNVKFKFSSYI